MVVRPLCKAVSLKRLSFLALTTSLVILTIYRFEFLWQHRSHEEVNRYADLSAPLTLGVANKVYVISLAKRDTRRQDMETLRQALRLRWIYVDAMDVTSPLVNSLLHWVARVRVGPPIILNEGPKRDRVLSLSGMEIPFQWPQDLESMAKSHKPLALWEEGTWPTPTINSNPLYYLPLVSATQNYNISEYSTKHPDYLLLTPARVACWHSHLSVIHKHANSIPSDNGGVAIILEDDIDMEMDTQEQLVALWPSLPRDWDVVFLGYCWSNENYHPPLGAHDHFQNPRSFKYRLHNSKSPKCTHAYALSRMGARRMLLHLRHPPFAYSRAIDQAISWLVESGRLKSYSVVPSLVIQRKVTDSDILSGKGSAWRDTLRHGFFQDSVPSTDVITK